MMNFQLEFNKDCKPYEINKDKSAIIGGEITNLSDNAVYFFELTYGVLIKKPGKVYNSIM